jgi:uncharacterized protein
VQLYLPIAEMPINVLLILAMSMGVGFISGIFGIGGGFLMTPLLIFSGVPASVAVATSAAQVTASGSSSALSAWRKTLIDPKLASLLVGGGFIGTIIGIALFNMLRRLGQLDFVITLSYIALLGTVGTLTLLEGARSLRAARGGSPRRVRRRGGDHPRWMRGPLMMRFPRSRLYCSAVPILALAASIGIAGAVLGIGGGFILVPALLFLFRVPTTIVVGTTQMQIVFTMAAATMIHALTNASVDILLALLLIIGGAVGAQFGARAGAKLKAESFRLLLGLLLLAVAIRFGVELVVPPTEPFSLLEQVQP